jgi:hypothetical protein
MSVAATTVDAMASRSNVSAGIITAQLDGRARYLLQRRVPRDVALEALREIGATPDLIRHAANTARTYYADKHPISAQQGADVADLLEGLLSD